MAGRNQLGLTLNLNISQRLAMTPALLQKIELLTLNRLELTELLNEELSENPVLEEVSEAQDLEVDPSTEEEQGDREDHDDFDYEYLSGEYSSPAVHGRDQEYTGTRPSIELFLATPSSLIDHLNWQLNLSEVSKDTHEIAYFVIGNINEDGYLTLSLEQISETLGTSIEKVKEGLAIVQSFDPIGVGSRDLRECLLLQVRAAGLEGSLVEKLVEGHLKLIQTKNFRELATKLNCKLEEISETLRILKGFSPDPGQKYNSQKPVTVQPDVYFHKFEDEFQIAMNNDDLPRLRLSRVYRKILKQKDIDKHTRGFIRERFRAAAELLRSLDQREETIYRVCKTIVERQRDFLDQGVTYLKPMLIKDVAEELQLHSSTISRVVSNKYAHTPQGLVELRKFFTIGIESMAGGSISVVNVKEKIRSIIKNENSGKPFSDQNISKLLNKEGVRITRRTVAKYRDQMKISGSRTRRIEALA